MAGKRNNSSNEKDAPPAKKTRTAKTPNANSSDGKSNTTSRDWQLPKSLEVSTRALVQSTELITRLEARIKSLENVSTINLTDENNNVNNTASSTDNDASQISDTEGIHRLNTDDHMWPNNGLYITDVHRSNTNQVLQQDGYNRGTDGEAHRLIFSSIPMSSRSRISDLTSSSLSIFAHVPVKLREKVWSREFIFSYLGQLSPKHILGGSDGN